MDFTQPIPYTTWVERNAICDEAHANGYVMLHDDKTSTGGVLTFIEQQPKSPEQLYQEQLEEEMNAVHEQAILALKNWGSLTLAQKDAVLRGLVKWALWKDGWLKLGVLD